MMRLPTVNALILALLTFSSSLRAEVGDESRSKLNFNSGWLVSVSDDARAKSVTFDDTTWKKVTLPYSWNEDSAFKVSILELPTGIAWYRKHFTLPAGTAGKKVFIEFEGIRMRGDFYLNDEMIGRSENGVMAFGFDITDKLRPSPAENVISVRTDNAWGWRQWNDRNFYANYGGINKNVILHITDKLHQTLPLYSNLGTTGVYIHAGDFDITGRSARIVADAEVKNEYPVEKRIGFSVSISDPGGNVVQVIDGGEHTLAPGATRVLSAGARVANLKFWSWGYGYLYNVTTNLSINGKPVDSVTITTGFRKTAFTNGMLTLNDRAIHLKGYAQRTTNEWPAVGSAVPPWMSDFSNSLIVASNGNLIRWMHVTPWKQDVESCDRVGLIQAMPAGDSEKDVTGRSWDQRVELMRDAIIYNRNNPSIIFYECGNAGISEEHMVEMKALRDKYDPLGGRAIGARDMYSSKSAEYGGHMLYINKSATKPMWMMEYSRDEGLRKFWDNWSPPYHKDGDGPLHRNQPAPEYNRNQDSHAIEDVVRWYEYWKERPGTGERVNAGGVNIVFSDTNTHYRGEENYRRSGEVDPMRLPKDGFFAHQVMWDGWVNTETPRIHIIGHWNYDAGTKKPVYAVSSADKVELFVNGRSVGFGAQSSRFLYTWKEVAFAAGEIKAIGYNSENQKVCDAGIRTAGEPVAIRLTPRMSPTGFKADGADMMLVDVEVVDPQGERCPTALNPVKFDLQGPAEWRGGIAQGPNNYILSRELPVECGVNRVMIRSLPQAGNVRLIASSKGLKTSEIEVASIPSQTVNGISRIFPDKGLKGHLGRGETPAGNSFVNPRRPARIVSVTAGSNSDQVAQAYDDNESTKWSSDGKAGTGWIEFTLQQPTTVTSITFKLGQFKKSYPLRVTVDGKEVFLGKTEPSLGYCSVNCKPTSGKSVRVALVGAIEDKTAFDMTEVTGKKLEDLEGNAVRGALEITEIEIY